MELSGGVQHPVAERCADPVLAAAQHSRSGGEGHARMLRNVLESRCNLLLGGQPMRSFGLVVPLVLG